jgi:hypothetical protein
MLESAGIGGKRLRTVEGVTGRAIIQSSKDGENSIGVLCPSLLFLQEELNGGSITRWSELSYPI